MLEDALIEEIGRRLSEATPRQSRVLLFGSRARGDETARSDVDILVIEPSVGDPIQESVRLRGALRGLGVPIDVLVISQAEAIRRSTVSGTFWSGPSGKGAFSLTPEESEEVGRLFRSARGDLRALKALAADAEQANEIIGFHAQQAVEKSIKAVLVAQA